METISEEVELCFKNEVKSIGGGIFRPASHLFLDILRQKQKSSEPTFVFPTKYISLEAAKIGYGLSHHVNQRREIKTIHRSFFAGSHLDAVSGVIKLIRHNHWLKTDGGQGNVLIYDKKQQLSSFFQPLKTHEEKLFVRGLTFTQSVKQASQLLDESSWIGFILCYDGTETIKEIEDLFALCKRKAILTALDESQLEDWYVENLDVRLKTAPDITVFGENLTDWQVPFGAFTATAAIYEPWNTIPSCLTHSSSYTGNTLSLAMVLALFSKYRLGNVLDLSNELSRDKKYQMYATYVNPQIAWIFFASGLSPEIKRAKGSELFIDASGKEERILDGAAGSGCCLRGHNPEGIVNEVLDKHNRNHDYWNDLCAELRTLTKMPYCFPAASGSSSTDIAVIIALLANPKRTRIITFKNNYSGKSLISLNLSRYPHFQEPFHPFYFDLVEIDPFDPNAIAVLDKELISGKVGLIWFEILQGQNLEMIPADVIDLINKRKIEGGYLIGIDEILTGFYRTGNFLCSDGLILKPDLIALAKGMSDMTFPIGCVLVSEQAYLLAKQKNSTFVTWLENHFITQIGSHIALHGLRKAIENNTAEHVKKLETMFISSLKAEVMKSPLHTDIKGKGLLLYMKLNKKAFPMSILGEEYIEFLMSSLYLKRGKVLFLNSRLTPPLTLTIKQMEELCQSLKGVLKSTNRMHLFFFCLKQVLVIHVLCMKQKIKEYFLRS